MKPNVRNSPQAIPSWMLVALGIAIIFACTATGVGVYSYLSRSAAQPDIADWNADDIKSALASDGVSCIWHDVPREPKGAQFCVDGNDPDLGTITIIPSPTEEKMREEVTVDLSALGIGPNKESNLTGLWTPRFGVSYESESPHSMTHLRKACSSTGRCTEIKSPTDYGPNSAASGSPATSQAGQPTSESPAEEATRAQTQTNSSRFDANGLKRLINDHVECSNGWQRAGNVEQCVAANGQVYEVYSDPESDQIAEEVEYFTSEAPGGDYYGVWASEVGVVIPANDSAWLDQVEEEWMRDGGCTIKSGTEPAEEARFRT